MSKKVVSTESAPKAVGPYSQAVAAGGLLFVSGQLGLVPATGKLADGDTAAQARQALDNLQSILVAAGAGLENVVKTTVLLKDMADFAEVNRVYAERFPERPPARAAYEVAALPLGALVEIEAVAVLD